MTPSARSSSHASLTIGVPAHTALSLVGRHTYLTAEQLCRRHYKQGSLTFTRATLKSLVDAGYLLRLFLPRPARSGSAPCVYTLARRGINYLESLGIDLAWRYRPGEQQARTLLHLAHSIAVTDVVLTFELFCEQHPNIRLARYIPERELRRQPIRVLMDNGKQVTVVPDGWLDLRSSKRHCLTLEVDRSTMMKVQMRTKVASLLSWVQSPTYQEHFQATHTTVLLIAMHGERRRMELQRWVEQELTARDAKQQANLFRLAAWPAMGCQPDAALLQPIWHQPFLATPFSLLTMGEVGR